MRWEESRERGVGGGGGDSIQLARNQLLPGECSAVLLVDKDLLHQAAHWRVIPSGSPVRPLRVVARAFEHVIAARDCTRVIVRPKSPTATRERIPANLLDLAPQVAPPFPAPHCLPDADQPLSQDRRQVGRRVESVR